MSLIFPRNYTKDIAFLSYVTSDISYTGISSPQPPDWKRWEGEGAESVEKQLAKVLGEW